MLVKTRQEWIDNTKDPIIIINTLQEHQIIDDKAMRTFFIFCCKQIYDLFDEDERRVIEMAENYLNGLVDLIDLNMYTYITFQSKKDQFLKSDTESRFMMGKLTLAMYCGYCQNNYPDIMFRRMARFSRGVYMLKLSTMTYAPEAYKVKEKLTNKQIKEIVDKLNVEQVTELKRLYKNPFE